MAEVGRAGQPLDVLSGGDVDGAGRLLSIAQLQAELRKVGLRALTSAPSAPADGPSGGPCPRQPALFPFALSALPAADAPAAQVDLPDAPVRQLPGATVPSAQGLPATGGPSGAVPGGPPPPRCDGRAAAPGALLAAPRPGSPPPAEPSGGGDGDADGEEAAGPLLAQGGAAGGGASRSSALWAAADAPEQSLGPGVSAAWVVVVAAHAGAGASTVALAVADAAAVTGPVHVIDTAEPARSGLLGAATRELGCARGWRRGTRGAATLDRRADATAPPGWPALPVGAAGPTPWTVLDQGLPRGANLAAVAAAGCRVVLVTRPTVPGVRAAELLLAGLPADRVVVAVVGTTRWSAAVTAAGGPLLAAARAERRLLAVPVERRLQASGLSDAPLPRPVLAAGRALLRLLADLPCPATAEAAPVPTPRGTP